MKMVSRENENSQEFTVFMQPPKKQTQFKHPSKGEEVLALSNSRKNTTWAYEILSDWLGEKEQQSRKKCPENNF